MITKAYVTELSKTLEEGPNELQERLDAVGMSEELPPPANREGLSTTVDTNRLPKTLANTDYSATTTHAITYGDDRIKVCLFSEADPHEKKLIAMNRYAQAKLTDRIMSLHKAATTEGILIIIPPGVKTTTPISIASNYDRNGFTHTIIIARKGSKATISRSITERREGESAGLVADIVEAIIENDAHITYNEHQTLSTKTAYYAQKRARTNINATIHWYYHHTGSSLTKQETTTQLNGAGSKAITLTTTKTAEEQHVDLLTTHHHNAAETESSMYSKAVAKGATKQIHRGLIDIGDEAKDANGYQQEDILIMGKNAEADTLPKLEIRNPDVTCSHGSTVSDIDEEQLFYLQSRGLDKKTAEQLIEDGFLTSILEYADDKEWQKQINTILGGSGETAVKQETAAEDKEETSDDDTKRILLERVRHPQNKGKMTLPTAEASSTQPWCNETITIQMRIEDDQVIDIKFSGTNCALATATTDIVTEHVKGKTVEEIMRIRDDEMLTLLGIDKEQLCAKCAFLPKRTIQKGIITWAYTQKKGEQHHA